MKVAAALLAAGSSCRMGRDKMTLGICGKTPLELSVEALIGAGIRDIVIAASDSTLAEAQRLSGRYGLRVTMGGASRGESVYNALSVMQCDIAVIHDGARCLVSSEVILDSIATAAALGSGIAALPARDAMRAADGDMLDRTGVMLLQTPQTFSYERIWKAYCLAKEEGFSALDDGAVYERLWGRPSYSRGSLQNQKLTYKDDLSFFSAALSDARIGMGEDTHRLVAGRRLVLGGVELPFRLGLLGHSDADVLLHAIIDAMLGAAALGDIGRMFPDTDEQYAGISSLVLLGRANEALRSAGYAIRNVDATVTAQEPKLAPHIEDMRKNIAEALGCKLEQVSVKATTPEHIGPEGALECITARSVCAIVRA